MTIQPTVDEYHKTAVVCSKESTQGINRRTVNRHECRGGHVSSAWRDKITGKSPERET